MALTFSANVTMMFREVKSTAERIAQAKACGFKNIEITLPYNESKDDISKALTEYDVKCSLINSWPGAGNLGIAISPTKVDEFNEKVKLSLDYAKAFNCSRLHVVAGCVDDQFTTQQIEETYITNVQRAADLAVTDRVTVLIEAVNSISACPGYFVDTPDKALRLIEQINRPNVKFQLDIFHLQIILGNLTSNIKKYLPHTDYIQISQVPGRNEPNSEGEINYKYVLNELVKADYRGYIGLEYMPIGDTTEGLKWIEECGYKL